MKDSILTKKADLLKLSREILKRGKSIRVQAKGWSMRPFILDGDLITISSFENSSLKSGDVVLYTTAGKKVIVHRLIKKHKRNGDMILLVKGDASFSSPEKINVKDILGKVTEIERNGRRKRLDTNLYRLIGLCVAGISPFSKWVYPLGSIVKKNGRSLLGGILEKLQGFKLYSILVKKILKENINYHTLTSDEDYSFSQLYRYNQKNELGKPLESLIEKERNAEVFKCYFVAKRKRRIIGSVTLTEYPKKSYPYIGWWLFDLWVNWRFRAIGVGEKLVKVAAKAASEANASEIKLLVFKDSKRATSLYQKLGFRQISIPELDKQLAHEAKETLRPRIILVKDLKST